MSKKKVKKKAMTVAQYKTKIKNLEEQLQLLDAERHRNRQRVELFTNDISNLETKNKRLQTELNVMGSLLYKAKSIIEAPQVLTTIDQVLKSHLGEQHERF